jgi:hypothetical protein
MSKSISTNLKTIIKQSTNLPLELTAASVELLADVATLGSAFITEVVPTTKDVGRATGTFVLGVFNSALSEEELKAKASTLTFASIRASIVAGAGKAWLQFGMKTKLHLTLTKRANKPRRCKHLMMQVS